jgi:branched-chain amino acid transport system ATP-binding protein
MTAVASPILRTVDLAKHYRGVKAVDGVTMAVNRGEIRGLIGPNGAGKSTVIDLASGRTKPTAGRVLLGGADITAFSVRKRRMAGVSRTFQRTSVFPALTVQENLRVAALKFPATDLDPIVAGMNLGALGDRRADEISYGEMRRLDIALAMVGDPEILLLDEPAAGLSKEDSRVLADHLQELTKRLQVTVVLVEHDMDVVFGICDFVTVLETGRVLVEGSPDEVRRSPAVIRAYLGTAA